MEIWGMGGSCFAVDFFGGLTGGRNLASLKGLVNQRCGFSEETPSIYPRHYSHFASAFLVLDGLTVALY